MSIYKYRIYCNVEQEFKYVWNDTDTPPTVCPVDTSHETNPDSINIEEIISKNTVYISIEDGKTGGNFCMTTFTTDIQLGTTENTYDFSFPMPINLATVSFYTSENNYDDVFSIEREPDTVIGVVTEDVPINMNLGITVSSTVIANTKLGYYLNIGGQNLGRCTAIGSGTIDTEFQTTDEIPQYSDVKRSIKLIDNYEIHQTGIQVFGASRIGSTYLPANTIGRILYKNNNGTAKKFTVSMEYFY